MCLKIIDSTNERFGMGARSILRSVRETEVSCQLMEGMCFDSSQTCSCVGARCG